VTAADQTITFRTKPSPDMIEMPVLFSHSSGARARALTNNVVNALVDDNRLFVAHVHGPTVDNVDLFNDYVDKAAELVGFKVKKPPKVDLVIQSEERVYHNGTGSIHCGTNVLREIPTQKWWNTSP
jgi:hypothetical protein